VGKENKVDEVAPRNVADANQVKVSEQEIDEELKKLEQPDKVQSDAALRQEGFKDPAQVPAQQDTQEKTLVKRDLHLSRDSENVDNKPEESDKTTGIESKDSTVSQAAGNQTYTLEKESNAPANKDISESVQHHSLDKRTLLGNNNKTAVEESHKVVNSIKIRDLKSNQKLKGKRVSSLSSKSFRTFLSKQHSKRSRRSNLQGETR